ncbi:MAG: BamA/TamA family outer membrane protein, partial [Bacteroidota bacterium]
QYSISLKPELFFARNRYYSSLNLAFSKILDRFYGIGNDTPESDKAPYLATAVDIEAKFRMPALFLPDEILVDLIYDFRYYSVIDTKENPLLINDLVPGSGGGLSSGIGFGFVWDNRDNIYFPQSGMFHQFRAVFNMQAIGSDFDYNDYQLDLRGFYAVAPDNIIAAQLYAQAVRGFPPFYEMAALGGSERMRGYFEGRYRDRNYITAQVEYRSIVWWRIGLVGFLGAGQVADRTREMRWDEFKPTYGVGLRFVLDAKEKVDLRVDFGWGRGTNGIYFAINEAF